MARTDARPSRAGDPPSRRDTITILIADDHRSFGEALQIALDKEQDLTVIEVVDDGDHAVRQTVDRAPDVVLMDLQMPDVDGIEATRRIREEGSGSAIIILSGDADELALARAIQAGARGFLQKTEAVTSLADAVRKAHLGTPLHAPTEVNHALKELRARGRDEADLSRRIQRLTPRELQILQAMTDGSPSERIAKDLEMSPHTLRTHMQNVLTKLGVHSKTDAVVAALRFGRIHMAPPVEPPKSGADG